VAEPQLPSFDLVVATVGRPDAVARLLASLERQTYRDFRVLLIDQSDDGRLAQLVGPGVELLHAEPGLSRARNAALSRIEADVVAFPDDDCTYPDDLLERVARRFADAPRLDGLTGRDQNAGWSLDATPLTRDNLWNRAISFTIFLRASIVAQVGAFDEWLGLPTSSGEEIDYLIRALDAGARIEYDPSIVVRHDAKPRPLAQLGARDGVSVGYIMRKHRYPPRTVARMLVRPVGGTFVALAHGDHERARFHLETARGRARAYQGMTVERLLAGVGRRVPVFPLRPLFPYAVWRPLFRLWLKTIVAQPDKRRAMRQLLQLYQDAYEGADRGAIAYDAGVHAKHRLMRYHDFFVERIHAGERVLDVGCGKGELAYDIAERSQATVIAIDASPWMLEFARGRFAHPRITYIQADAVGYVPEAPVDVAVLSNVLEHVAARGELLRALREQAGARRLLLRVPVLDRDWTVPLRRELGLAHFSDPEHKLEYEPELLRGELADAGWTMGDPILRWGEIWVEASAG
jgi:SAM-dependent methyltransferase/glycosyltransferase involved in cell wall biosynthesis